MKKVLVIIFIFLIIGFIASFWIFKNSINDGEKLKKEKKENTTIDYKINYNSFVKATKDISLYDNDNNKNEIGNVSSGSIVELDEEYEIVDEYDCKPERRFDDNPFVKSVVGKHSYDEV